MSNGLVLYADGSCRPTNPGNVGWGIHGYLYDTEIGKKISHHPDHILTANGYVTKAEALNNASIKEVTPIHYIDGYGSISSIASNNVGELAAAINGLRHAIKYSIEVVQVFTDSEYVRKGFEQYADKWKANNWLKYDNSIPANVDYWKELLDLRDQLIQRSVLVKITWVKGHADILGNEIADRLANVGSSAAMRKMHISVVDTTADANSKYWKPVSEHHPFISNRRMYFNTMPDYIRPGEYYLGEHGKDDDLLGKRISDGAYSVIKLNTPDPTLELVRDHQSKLANGIDTIIMTRLDQLFRPGTYNEIQKYGTLAMDQASPYRLDLFCLDKEPLTRELKPPKLALRAVESISDIAGILHMYQDNHEKITTTDITDVLYESVTTTNKKNVSTTEFKLKPEYVVGHPAIKTNVNYATLGMVKNTLITMTLGLDLPDRNTLKRIESLKPKVTVVSWNESHEIFKFATVIEVEDGSIGIWCSYYSNLCVVPRLL